jgi:hypothetical protein
MIILDIVDLDNDGKVRLQQLLKLLHMSFLQNLASPMYSITELVSTKMFNERDIMKAPHLERKEAFTKVLAEKELDLLMKALVQVETKPS